MVNDASLSVLHELSGALCGKVRSSPFQWVCRKFLVSRLAEQKRYMDCECHLPLRAMPPTNLMQMLAQSRKTICCRVPVMVRISLNAGVARIASAEYVM